MIRSITASDVSLFSKVPKKALSSSALTKLWRNSSPFVAFASPLSWLTCRNGTASWLTPPAHFARTTMRPGSGAGMTGRLH